MTLLPVVAREMGALARRKSTYVARAMTAGVGLGIVIWLVGVAAAQMSLSGEGKAVFITLSSICFGYALVAGIATTADSVSEEKREGTIGLLFLTDLKGYDIVLGKLAASSLNTVFTVFGVVPMLTVALLLGGVTLWQILLAALVIINGMFLSLACGVFVSTISRNERKATLAAAVALFFIVLGPYLFSAAFGFDLVEEIIWVSPLYSFLTVHAWGGGTVQTEVFWFSLVFQQALAWFLIWRAASILPKTIHDLPRRGLENWRGRFDRLVFGTPAERKQYRAELLDRNAFLWLASRERAKPRYAWGIITFFAGLYGWIYWQFPRLGLDFVVISLVLFLAHLTFKAWIASEVCSRLIEDRRSGALELLLCSPLGEKQIAHGQSLALKRIFLKPVAVLVGLEVFLILLAEKGGVQYGRREALVLTAGLTTLLLDIWALKWVGLWHSLFGKSIERVMLTTLFRVLLLPWIVFAAVQSALLAWTYSSGVRLPQNTSIIVWWLISIFVSLILGASARSGFLRHFRETAAQRFDAVQKPQSSLTLAIHDLVRDAHLLRRGLAFIPAPVRRHYLLSAFASILVLITAITFGRQVYYKSQINRELQALKAQGEPTSEKEIFEFFPPVLANENAYESFFQAGSVTQLRSLPSPSQMYAMRAQSESERAQLRSLVSRHREQLAAGQSVTNYARFYLRTKVPNAWPMLQVVQGYPLLLLADLALACEDKDYARAQRNLLSLLHLAALLRPEPMVELQLLSFRTLHCAAIGMELLFPSDALTMENLSLLRNQLVEIHRIQPLKDILRVNRAVFIESLTSQPDRRGGPPSRLAVAWASFLKLSGTADQVAHQILRALNQANVYADWPEPTRLHAARELQFQVEMAVRKLQFIQPRWHGDSINFYFTQDALILARLRTMLTALDVKEFEMQQQKHLQSSKMLPAATRPEYRTDPFSGEALTFRNENRYQLRIYSLGPNQKDDQGVESNASYQGDIVFTYHRN